MKSLKSLAKAKDEKSEFKIFKKLPSLKGFIYFSSIIVDTHRRSFSYDSSYRLDIKKIS